MSKLHRRLAAFVVALLSVVSPGANATDVYGQTQSAETAAISLLAEHFRFEESLLSPDNDRLMVFLSVPHGARVIIDQVVLRIDGKPVATYAYAGTELLSFQRRSAQLLYAGRLPAGEHKLRIDVKTIQGTVLPMRDFSFTKDDQAKYIELQLAGYNAREVFATDW